MNTFHTINPFHFLGALQRTYFREPALSQVFNAVAAVPNLRAQDDDEHHTAYLHYLVHTEDTHWYITELDTLTMRAYGYVVLPGLKQYACIDLARVTELPGVGLDVRFKPISVEKLIEEVNQTNQTTKE